MAADEAQAGLAKIVEELEGPDGMSRPERPTGLTVEYVQLMRGLCDGVMVQTYK